MNTINPEWEQQIRQMARRGVGLQFSSLEEAHEREVFRMSLNEDEWAIWLNEIGLDEGN